ncbi:MAG: alanyl-tRNA editing protein [Candidatus Aenigmarchaeota archaeon]|nr:alanyl-tRNA editing protein [Candidatus Aenigmarchaeota archaeon]
MSRKLFWEDPYMKTAKVQVVSIDGTDVVVDKTIFFAFSGGQADDYGSVGGIKLSGLRVEGDDIVHVLEREADFSVGDEVELALDWDRRYRIMKLHSAAHIVYFFAVDLIGQKELIGSNVDVSKSRIDFVMDSSIGEYLPEIERLSNEFIAGNREIVTQDDEDNSGRRIWVCDDMSMPCGGTHVKNTQEIGVLRLKRKNIGAGKERVEVMLNE